MANLWIVPVVDWICDVSVKQCLCGIEVNFLMNEEPVYCFFSLELVGKLKSILHLFQIFFLSVSEGEFEKEIFFENVEGM